MSQPALIPARLLQRHQSQIARDLLATLKPIRSPDDSAQRPVRSAGPPRDASSTAALRGISQLPDQSPALASRSSGSFGPATPAGRAGAGSPRGLTETTPVVPVPLLATTSSCSVGLR